MWEAVEAKAGEVRLAEVKRGKGKGEKEKEQKKKMMEVKRSAEE